MSNASKYKALKQIGIFTLVLVVLSAIVVMVSRFINPIESDYERNLRAKVGEPFVIDVPGRTSIEYRWQINKGKSKGLELLEISHIGWIYPMEDNKKKRRSSFGTPRTAKFYLQPKAPGIIQLTLEYKKRGIVDDIPQRVRDFTIHVEP